jgi:hypothetical protein
MEPMQSNIPKQGLGHSASQTIVTPLMPLQNIDFNCDHSDILMILISDDSDISTFGHIPMPLKFCVKHQNHVFPANLKEIETLFTSNIHIIPMPFCVKHRNHVFPADSKEIEFAQRSAASSASSDH